MNIQYAVNLLCEAPYLIDDDIICNLGHKCLIFDFYAEYIQESNKSELWEELESGWSIYNNRRKDHDMRVCYCCDHDHFFTLHKISSTKYTSSELHENHEKWKKILTDAWYAAADDGKIVYAYKRIIQPKNSKYLYAYGPNSQ